MSLSPTRLRLLVASLLTVTFLGALDHTVVSTSLATIAGELNALEEMGWVVVSYTLASTVLLPVIGKLGDIMGARSVFIASLILFLIASLACGFAPNMGLLIAARVFQGMSSAGLQLMSQTIVAQVTSPRARPKYMAIIGAAFPVAILVGPFLGGLIADNWGWQWLFWINLPVGIIALILALCAIPSIPRTSMLRFDTLGAVAFTIALVALVLGVTWVSDGQLLASALSAFALALAAFTLFFWAEVRAENPLVPLAIFKNRTVSVGTLIAAVNGVGLISITAYLPTYVQMAYGTSATVSGLVPIATVMGMLVSNLLVGFLASKTGRYRIFPIIGTALGAAGLFTMSLLPVGLPLWTPMVVMFVVGLGSGSFMSLMIAVVQSAAPKSATGAVTASVSIVGQVGTTVTTAVIGGVIGVGVIAMLPLGVDAAGLTPAAVHASEPAFQATIAAIYRDVFSPIFVGLSIVYLAGFAAALLLPSGRLSSETGDDQLSQHEAQKIARSHA
ncbi:MFS transporter [Pseudoclavibacter sp. AY1F1]|uniref:MFS transporter n=1 Tax=Pseudoclavibacter sp. AY1F1 TaxID=2080583 RepID=UPI000CE913F7|nr:MFS transporter [Pseudoclavibacter sp. AY1F1]PPF43295.1 MFS transporter [Pseudoclavibacter sp. AY1F1]